MQISTFGQHMWIFASLITFLILWSLAWKGFALWTAARKGSKVWFVILLVLNTLGILEIIYIFLVAKHGKQDQKAEEVKNQIK